MSTPGPPAGSIPIGAAHTSRPPPPARTEDKCRYLFGGALPAGCASKMQGLGVLAGSALAAVQLNAFDTLVMER